VVISRAYEELRTLAEKAQIPVITTLLGISSFPQNHMLSLGMLGMHGLAYANLAVSSCDLLIAIGMRFDDRATGKVSAFAPNAKIVHIDVDTAEIGKNIEVDIPIVADAKKALDAIYETSNPTGQEEI
jgi:acetolactate synthase-1/2/3 large subunit